MEHGLGVYQLVFINSAHVISRNVCLTKNMVLNETIAFFRHWSIRRCLHGDYLLSKYWLNAAHEFMQSNNQSLKTFGECLFYGFHGWKKRWRTHQECIHRTIFSMHHLIYFSDGGNKEIITKFVVCKHSPWFDGKFEIARLSPSVMDGEFSILKSFYWCAHER